MPLNGALAEVMGDWTAAVALAKADNVSAGVLIRTDSSKPKGGGAFLLVDV